ncbi:MAG: HAD-IA family hydrolase [Pirellulaceae bacterium]|nr:HAD-IA family hydrolase [Pirellulaceae bacterium]
MPTHYSAWTWMLDQFGIPFPEEKFYDFAGKPTELIIKLLAEETRVVVHDIAAMSRLKEQRYVESIDAVKPIQVVLDIATRHRDRLPMAVASGGEGYVVARTLNVIGVGDWFKVVVAAEDTQRHKPEPDVFLEAARRLDVDPTGCVVFEDSDLGLLAAERAGMMGVDVRPWY